MGKQKGAQQKSAGQETQQSGSQSGSQAAPAPAVTEVFSGLAAMFKEFGDDLEKFINGVKKHGVLIAIGVFLATRRGRKVAKEALTAAKDAGAAGIKILQSPSSEVGQAFHWGRGGLIQARWRQQEGLRRDNERIKAHFRRNWFVRAFNPFARREW